MGLSCASKFQALPFISDVVASFRLSLSVCEAIRRYHGGFVVTTPIILYLFIFLVLGKKIQKKDYSSQKKYFGVSLWPLNASFVQVSLISQYVFQLVCF